MAVRRIAMSPRVVAKCTAVSPPICLYKNGSSIIKEALHYLRRSCYDGKMQDRSAGISDVDTFRIEIAGLLN